MSVEAPGNSGTGEPIPPRKPEGTLLVSLRRFFGVSDQQPHQQPTPRIIQAPPGLEAFADSIQQVVDGCFFEQRQATLDIEAAKAAQIATKAEEERKAAERPRELEQQERSRLYREEQERIAGETSAILTSFRVVDRLQYIKDTVWGGKGEIRPMGGESFIAGKKANYTHQNYAYNKGTYMGGFELAYSYPSLKLLDRPETSGRLSLAGPSYTPGSPHMQQYVPDTNSTRLRVRVLNVEQDSGEDRKELSISSVADLLTPDCLIAVPLFEFFSVCIPREAEEKDALLESVLMQEAVKRVDRGCLPSQLEEEARQKLATAKRDPRWQKWKKV